MRTRKRKQKEHDTIKQKRRTKCVRTVQEALEQYLPCCDGAVTLVREYARALEFSNEQYCLGVPLSQLGTTAGHGLVYHVRDEVYRVADGETQSDGHSHIRCFEPSTREAWMLNVEVPQIVHLRAGPDHTLVMATYQQIVLVRPSSGDVICELQRTDNRLDVIVAVAVHPWCGHVYALVTPDAGRTYRLVHYGAEGALLTVREVGPFAMQISSCPVTHLECDSSRNRLLMLRQTQVYALSLTTYRVRPLAVAAQGITTDARGLAYIIDMAQDKQVHVVTEGGQLTTYPLCCELVLVDRDSGDVRAVRSDGQLYSLKPKFRPEASVVHL